MKKSIKWVSVIVSLFLILSNCWIVFSTSDRVISDTRELIGTEVGLVFGTSHKLIGGDPNPFFENRMIAAYELVRSGKVEKLILSGSSDSIYYHEPRAMEKSLLDMGLSEEQLLLDDQGIRTLHSIARLRDIHGYNQVVLITQKYHGYRALFLADRLGVEAVCYEAATPMKENHVMALLREIFARAKAVLDVYVLNA